MADLPLATSGQSRWSPTHIVVGASAADEFPEVSCQVVATVVLLDTRRPVIFAGTDQNLLRIRGYEPIDGGLVVNF